MEAKPKNRDWVKNVSIIFLSVLLVLTFFSNTWMNRSLPEVATQYVTNGTITAKVRGTGTVTAVGVTTMKAEQTREIRAVMVKVGQEVETGDVLFVLGQGEASELEAAQETLRQLQLSYQKTAAGIVYPSYAGDERRIKAAKEAMDLAKKRLDEIASGASGSVEELLKKQSEINKKQEEAEKVRDAEREAYDALVKEAQDVLTVKAQERDDAQRALTQNGITFLERTNVDIWKFQTRDNYVDLYSNGDVKEVTPIHPVQPASLYAVYPSRYSHSYLSLFSESDTEKTEPTLEEETSPEEGGTDTPTESPTPTVEPQPTETPSTPTPAPEVSPEELELMREFQRKQQAVDEAQKNLEDIPRSNLDAAQEEVNKLQKEYDQIQEMIDSIMAAEINSEAYLKASEAYKEAQDSYWSLVENLEEKRNSDARTQSLSYIDLQDLTGQIERAKKKVEELAGGEENQITAKVSGTIQSIDCAPGDTKLKGDLLCTIEVPDMGYTLSFSVTNDQARRLKPGDSATVSNYYWGNQVTATLESIKTDPKNPQTNKILTFDVTGDVSAGSELTISVGQKSATYDIIVPNSSIRSDTNGSFVLAVESKSSPLGNRYLARRVEVKVLAEDDMNSAVTGDLGYGDYVITTSNAPVKNGDMVRLADNG